MPKAPFGDLFQYLRGLYPADAADGRTDGELLQRFARGREEDAFKIVVHRHARMVLSVCERLLGDRHLAEDSFQATFIVLARRAGSMGTQKSVGTWLYVVAQRIALKARSQRAVQRKRERQIADMRRAERLDDETWEELRTVLDEEIGRLPEKYRAPLVLCHLESKSQEQAARELGWAKSTLARRLGRARDLLRQQLIRRGLTLSAGVLATALGDKAAGAPVAALLTAKTAEAAAGILSGKAVVGVCLTARALDLAEEALTGMLLARGKLVVIVMALGLAVGGAGWASYKGLAATSQSAPADNAQPAAPKEKAEGPAKKDQPIAVDRFGDPLPAGAIGRLGTVRFRQAAWTSSIAYALGGKVLVTGGMWGPGLCIWDTATGQPLHRLSVPAEVRSMAVSADGKTLMTDSLVFIDIATGKETGRIQRTADGSFKAAFAPDGRIAAAVQAQGQLKVFLWDTATRQRVRVLEGHTDRVNKPAFSPDGKTLATGSDDNTLRLWDVETGKELRRIDVKDSCEVIFAPDGKTLATFDGRRGVRDREVGIWDIKTGTLVYKLQNASRVFLFA